MGSLHHFNKAVQGPLWRHGVTLVGPASLLGVEGVEELLGKGSGDLSLPEASLGAPSNPQEH